jgi:hypothetical protein
MAKRPIHPARKLFRYALLVLLILSAAFLSMMVTLRVQYRNDKPIEGNMQVRVFQFDILQHRALTYIHDDAGDMRIAEELLRNGMFSPLYTQAGLDMLSVKADEGYKPAIERLDSLSLAK